MTPAVPPAYDVAVAYRVYPKVSPPARSLPFGDNKALLAEICLRSFWQSVRGLRVKLWAILDGCPPEYEEFFRRYIPAEDLVILNLEGAGNGATFERQIDILLKQTDARLVYFAEDDYFYLPGKFRGMVNFLTAQPDVDFISPFDHLDCYTLTLHHGPKWLRVHDSQHWRTASSTCLTFLTRKQTLAEYASVFRSYCRGNFDSSLWLSLTKQRVFNPLAMVGYLARREFYWKIMVKAWFYNWAQILFGRKSKLWVPVPGIATHLDSASLSPGINWLEKMQQEIDAKSTPPLAVHADMSLRPGPVNQVKPNPVRTLVVLLNWNSQAMTEECVRSLQEMDGAAFRILIVDNGSKDGSAEYLQSTFPDIELIINSRNLGFTGGCNVAMRRALERDTEFVLLVNNDTIVNKGFLTELIAEAGRNPKAGMISPKIYYFDVPDRIWWAGGAFSLWQGIPRHLGWKEIETGQYEKTQPIDWATGCGILVRCAALREAGLFDEKIFANGEDLDLSLRMRNLGWQIIYVPTARMWHKEGFATRRNVGEHVRKFTASRNVLYVMHKHASPIHWLTFWPYFLVRYVAVIAIKSLLIGDWRSAWATLAGIWAFFRMRLDPDSSPLPAALASSTKNPG